MSAMAGYQPQSDDAHPDADRATFDRLRAMTPEERMRAAAELTASAIASSIAGLRMRHPTASEDELRLRAAVQRYGRAWLVRFLGEDALRDIA